LTVANHKKQEVEAFIVKTCDQLEDHHQLIFGTQETMDALQKEFESVKDEEDMQNKIAHPSLLSFCF
jgi:hypothetical protein